MSFSECVVWVWVWLCVWDVCCSNQCYGSRLLLAQLALMFIQLSHDECVCVFVCELIIYSCSISSSLCGSLTDCHCCFCVSLYVCFACVCVCLCARHVCLFSFDAELVKPFLNSANTLPLVFFTSSLWWWRGKTERSMQSFKMWSVWSCNI